jgi:hypothetical protein
MIRRLALPVALLAATALAACSGEPEAPAIENEADNVVVVDETPTENIVVPEETPSPTPTPAPIVEEDKAADEQVQEDADAVGMTARLPRTSGGNEAAPTE